jgi:hypothetical protein
MNMKSGLLGLGLLLGAGALTISCGGKDDENGSGNTAGKGSGTSGSGSGVSGSGSGTAGSTANTGGSGNQGTAGTTSTAGTGTSTGGNSSNGGNANNGGAPSGGTGNNNGGAAPGNNENCPATAPTDAATCDVMTGRQGCTYGNTNCRCQRSFGGPGGNDGGAPAEPAREWNCNEIPTFPGNGGAGNEGGFGSIGDVECPDAKPANMAACTGTGFCPYQGGGCVCNGTTFTCFGN